MKTSADLLDLFLDHVRVTDDPADCWEWTVPRDSQGYGWFRPEPCVRIKAHRWLLGHMRGNPLRWDNEVKEHSRHRCGNKSCCNPTHLCVGTNQENQKDAEDHGTAWWLDEGKMTAARERGRKQMADPELRSAVVTGLKKKWRDPEYRARMSEAVRQGNLRRWGRGPK